MRTPLNPPWLRPESGAEADSSAGRRCQNFARHLPLRLLGEVQPAAMHRNQDVRIELADLADDLRKVIRRCGPKVKASHDGMNLRNARHFHRLAHGIDDTDVAAGADDYETLVLQIEARGVLMDVLIGHDLAFHFSGQIMARVASGAVLELELHHGVRKHLFDAAALDLACRECLAADHDGRLTQHELDVLPGDIAAVEHPKVAKFALPGPGVALAEIVLAAGLSSTRL